MFKYLRLGALEPHDLVLAELPGNIDRHREDVKRLAARGLLHAHVLRSRTETGLRDHLGRPDCTALTLASGSTASSPNRTRARSFWTRYGGVDEQLPELPSGTREAPASRGDGDLRGWCFRSHSTMSTMRFRRSSARLESPLHPAPIARTPVGSR